MTTLSPLYCDVCRLGAVGTCDERCELRAADEMVAIVENDAAYYADEMGGKDNARRVCMAYYNRPAGAEIAPVIGMADHGPRTLTVTLRDLSRSTR